MKSIKIIGAGYAGLIAATLLRHHDVEIWEKALSLPDNHNGLLRFRSNEIFRRTGLPCKAIEVTKGVWDGKEVKNLANIPESNRYSQRVTGQIQNRSILNLSKANRFLSYPDFRNSLAKRCSIEFDSPANSGNLKGNPDCAIISTMPLPVILNIVGIPFSETFDHSCITQIRYKFKRPDVFVNQTVYNGSRVGNWYRLTLEESEVIFEYSGKVEHRFDFVTAHGLVSQIFGFDCDLDFISHSVNPFGKISPISEDKRKAYLYELTQKYGIYSLGRLATWRPGLLLDDLVQDVDKIAGFIAESSHYEVNKNK